MAEKLSYNDMNPKSQKKRPKFIEMNVDPDFAHTIVGWHVATRKYCDIMLWEYIKKQNLFTCAKKQYFIPNHFLSPVIGDKKIHISEGKNKFLSAMLYPLKSKVPMSEKVPCPICKKLIQQRKH